MPDWKRIIREKLAANGQQPDDDVVEELAQHVEATFERARADGEQADEATRRVEALVGAWCARPAALRRRPRRAPAVEPPPTASGPFAGLGQDIRYSLRLLMRDRAHSVLALLTMALTIGATTTLFSVVSGVLLEPLPYPDADRLVRVSETRQGRSGRVPCTISNGTFVAWNDKPTTIEGIGGWMQAQMTMTDGGDAVRVGVGIVTPGLFAVLGVHPAVGRTFVPGEGERIGEGGPIILSHGLWQERFAGRSDILGHGFRLDGQPYVVAGIMPRGFAFPDSETRAWVPWDVPTMVLADGTTRFAIFATMARLRPGVTLAQAAAEGTARGRAAPDPGVTALALFGAKGPVDVRVSPAVDVLTAEVRPAILVLSVAVLLLFATGTANIASLQLARATTRRRELAVRSAIGASAGRLARQSLIESGLIGVMGGLLGLVCAVVLTRLLPRWLPVEVPRIDTVTVDAPVVLFALSVTLLACVACGLLPVWHARRVSLVEVLSEDGMAPAGGAIRTRSAKLRALIMVFQMVMACMLLVGSALLGRSLVALTHADRGFDPVNLLSAEVPLRRDYPAQRRVQVMDSLVERLGAIPGVTQAAVSNALPFVSIGRFFGFTIPSRRDPGLKTEVQTQFNYVSPGYLGALRLRLTEGRWLSDGDTRTSPLVLVVNRTFATMYLEGKAVGERIPVRHLSDNSEIEIVGVIDDLRQGGASAAPQPAIFVSYRQLPPDRIYLSAIVLTIRTSSDPRGVIPAVRRLVKEQDASLPLESVMTMEDRVTTSLSTSRTLTVLLGVFSVCALLIAGVGLFGLLSYSVAQRVREIGVRVALGASERHIVWLVLGQALAITASGTALGLLAAAALGKGLSRLLYGVTSYDATSFLAVPVVLLIVAAVASATPALRAARVDPIRALRGER